MPCPFFVHEDGFCSSNGHRAVMKKIREANLWKTIFRSLITI